MYCCRFCAHPGRRKRITVVNEALEFSHLIFTDGAKRTEGVGSAFTVWVNNREQVSRQFRLSNACSSFQAELFAVAKAVDWLIQSSKNQSYIICTDNHAVICLFNNIICKNQLAIRTANKLVDCGRMKDVSLCWVPGHQGIPGNERADALAGEVCSAEIALQLF